MARSKGISQTTTTTFEKVGSYDSVVNMSGQRSPYTMPEGRKGPTSPDMGGGNGSARRSATMIHEANGPACTVTATRGFAPEYPETGRAFRTVPSRAGVGDFWDQRQANGGQTLARDHRPAAYELRMQGSRRREPNGPLRRLGRQGAHGQRRP